MFSVCLSVDTPRGTHIHPIILPLFPYPFYGGTPVLAGGYPNVRQGVPQSQAGGTSVLGYPPARTALGYIAWPGHDWGTPPPPKDRTAEEVLATRRAVCLLRSRRRTVLLHVSLILKFEIFVCLSLSHKMITLAICHLTTVTYLNLRIFDPAIRHITFSR